MFKMTYLLISKMERKKKNKTKHFMEPKLVQKAWSSETRRIEENKKYLPH